MKKTEFEACAKETDTQQNQTSNWPDPDFFENGPEMELSNTTLTHPLAIDQYLYILETAIVKAGGKTGRSQYTTTEFLLDYFLAHRCEYEKVKAINPKDKKYPIFGEYIFVDMPLAMKYNELRTYEFKNYLLGVVGDSDSQGATERFLKEHDVLYFEYELADLFALPEFYADLRERAYAAYIPIKKEKQRLEERGKRIEFTTMFEHKLGHIRSGLEENESLRGSNDPFAYKVYNIVRNEVLEHLYKFDNEKYLNNPLSLSDRQRAMLTLYFIYKQGITNVSASNVTRFMASCFGGKASRYDDAVKNFKNAPNTWGYADKNALKDSLEQITNIFGALRGENSTLEKDYKRTHKDINGLKKLTTGIENDAKTMMTYPLFRRKE